MLSADAHAAAVATQTSQGRYVFVAAKGEANTLTIDGDATHYTFNDSVPISDLNGGCTPLSATSLRCPREQGATAMSRIRVELSAIALAPPLDSAPNTFRYSGQPPAGTATEQGLFVGTAFSDSRDDISGSSGNDSIQSFLGVDDVAGGDGDDLIIDSGGASGSYSGGGGNDDIRALGPFSEDLVSGGDGNDVLLAGTGVDKVLGEGGNDMLETGPDPGVREGDVLDGGVGDDALVEEPGDINCPFTVADTNIGGPGQDTVYDDCGGQDIFELKDGETDKWHCGGTVQRAELDKSDVLVPPTDLCNRGLPVRLSRVVIKGRKASFSFNAYESDVPFECKLDNGKFKGCKSPQTYRNLKRGKHVFQVRSDAGDLPSKAKKWRFKTPDKVTIK